MKKIWNTPITWGSLTKAYVIISALSMVGGLIYTEACGLTDCRGWIKEKLTKNSGKEEEES